MKGFNLTGEEVLLKLSGYSSIVVQHEIDHLDGIMFYDRMNKENPFQLPDNIKSLY